LKEGILRWERFFSPPLLPLFRRGRIKMRKGFFFFPPSFGGGIKKGEEGLKQKKEK